MKTSFLILAKLLFGCISESDFINVHNLTTGLPFSEANAVRVGARNQSFAAGSTMIRVVHLSYILRKVSVNDKVKISAKWDVILGTDMTEMVFY